MFVRMKKSALSLVEIIIYFAILSVGLLVTITFAIRIGTLYGLMSNMNDMQSDIDYFGERISYAVANADSIDVGESVLDSDGGKIVFNMSDASLDPTMFYLDSGNIFIKEGVASAIQLNTDAVTVESLRFHRLTYSKTPDQLQIDAVFLNAVSDRNDLDYSIPFHISLSLRK